MEEPLPCLRQVELIRLSKDIPHTSYIELCDAMGYSYTWNQSILATHRGNYIDAVTEILIKWNTEQADTSQSRSILAGKLHKVELGGLGMKLSEGEYLPKQQGPDDTEQPPGEYLPRQQGPDDTERPQGQDIYSKKISESLTVQQCREKLKNKYLTQLCKIQKKPWDQTDYAEFKDMHTVVTMVTKDANGKDTTQKKILEDSVAEIFSTKVNDKLPARILITAPAGGGKTTAVAKIAYDWVHGERGSALEQLPLLFVVKFRNTSQRTSIGEAIKSQLLSDVHDLTPEGLENFIRENQGNCHIILDGLDEYAGISSSTPSSESNIVRVICWQEFPECRVLVTTRPHLEYFFNEAQLPRVYTKMWIEGFSQKSKLEYIDKFFASTSIPDRGHDLKVYLHDQPMINELVKTPLFCLMVCHLWSEGLLNTETATQTDVIDSVNVFLMQHANARSKSKSKGKLITDKNLDKIICKLGKVALAGLMDDSKKLVFTPYDFRRVPAILDRACELGILSMQTIATTGLPRSHETISTTIEFYHKLAQEHSAGKYLAAKTKKYMLRLKISKLDRLLDKIKANTGDYENLIRFAAGTDNSLCIRIMEALLSNSFLDESERYRILLDCSSQTKGTKGKVSSLVQRCVTDQGIVLKSPTVYTVVGMLNLPMELKHKVTTVKLEGSAVTADVTSGLWSCLEAFLMLHTLIISDPSLSFPPSLPELLSVTKLSAEKVTLQSYTGVLSSIPGVREMDVSIDVTETSNTFQITTASRPRGQTRARDEQFFVHIRLHAWPALTTVRKIDSGGSIGGLSLLFGDQPKSQQRLHISGVKDRDEEVLVDLFVKTKQLKSLNLGTGGGSLKDKHAVQNTMLEIQQCQLSTEMTEKLWYCLSSFTALKQLSISDSSLCFPHSPPELSSVTKLSIERVTAQSYEGLLSSLPDLRDITIDDAEKDIPEITAGLRRTGGQQLTHITITTPLSLPSKKMSVSSETVNELGLLIREQTRNLQWLCLSRVKGTNEEDLVELVESCKHVNTMNHLMLLGCGTNTDGRLSLHITGLHMSNSSLRVIALHDDGQLFVEKCQLSSEMTERMWSCLRSFTSLNHLTISDSSLSFPQSPPELPFVTNLSAERVTLQSYEGLLSSLPFLGAIDITIDDAERDIPQITASLGRTEGQQLTHVTITTPPSLPSEKKSVSSETMRGLGLLIRKQTKKLQWLCLSRVKGTDEKDLVELVQFCKHVDTMNHIMLLGCGTKADGELSLHITRLHKANSSLRVIVLHDGDQLFVEKCQLSSEMTARMWSCLRSFTSLNHITISDSSLSFPPSLPELPSVTELSAKRLSSQELDDMLSSLPGLRDIDITVNDAERDISQITAGLRRTGGQQLTHIRLEAPSTLPSGKKSVSRETLRGLGLIIEQTKNLQWLCLSRVKGTDEEDLVELVESCRHVKTMKHLMLLGCGTNTNGGLQFHRKVLNKSMTSLRVIALHDNDQLFVEKCQLSSEMTARMWSCLTSFTSLHHLTISDSSLSFPPSLPELPSVTELSAKRVTSQRFDSLLSSLPGLREIDFTIDDAERDISQITAGLRRTGGQQLTHITLEAPSTLPSGNKSVSRKTMRGLGLIIEQTKNLQRLCLSRVKGTDEEDLVELVESCRHVKTMNHLMLFGCGTRKGGRLESYLQNVRKSPRGGLSVWVFRDGCSIRQDYHITHTY